MRGVVRFIDDRASRRYAWYPGDGEHWIRGLAAVLLGAFAFALLLLFTRSVMVAAVVGTSVTAGMAGLNLGRRDARELTRFAEVLAAPRRKHAVMHTGRAMWRGIVEGTGGAVAAIIIVNLPEHGLAADWLAPLAPAVVGALGHQVGMMHERVAPRLPPARPSRLPKALRVPWRGKTPGEFYLAEAKAKQEKEARAGATAAPDPTAGPDVNAAPDPTVAPDAEGTNAWRRPPDLPTTTEVAPPSAGEAPSTGRHAAAEPAATAQPAATGRHAARTRAGTGGRHAAGSPATSRRTGKRRVAIRRVVSVAHGQAASTPAAGPAAERAAEPDVESDGEPGVGSRPAPVIRTGERHVGRARIPS